MQDLFTGLIIGLVGSLHCLGMCGPIAVSLPLGKGTTVNKLAKNLVFHGGRLLTYGVLGAVFGTVGTGIRLAGLQQWASIGIGIIMILSLVIPYIFNIRTAPENLFSGLSGIIAGRFGDFFRKPTFFNLLLAGFLNGLLPCGLVYVALAGALNTHSLLSGVLFMLAFGFGTVPALVSLSLLGNLAGMNIRKKIKRIVPAFILILGVLFILRGLNLGIPYISPSSSKLVPHEKTHPKENCCK